MQKVASDIIVIGAGGCGLMAALVAAKKGARVLKTKYQITQYSRLYPSAASQG